ncbi:MAG: hypothetical protein M1820_001489 [Bogoriella megaspora]|nr:MAG: hypothetical protein M1820_001489 [Bogoriella megaspora]
MAGSKRPRSPSIEFAPESGSAVKKTKVSETQPDPFEDSFEDLIAEIPPDPESYYAILAILNEADNPTPADTQSQQGPVSSQPATVAPTVVAKPYACTKCNKSFRKLYELRQHMDTHWENLKPYLCNKCTNTYPTERALERHIKRDHSDPASCKFPCRYEGCDSSYASNYIRNEHERQHHGTFHPSRVPGKRQFAISRAEEKALARHKPKSKRNGKSTQDAAPCEYDSDGKPLASRFKTDITIAERTKLRDRTVLIKPRPGNGAPGDETPVAQLVLKNMWKRWAPTPNYGYLVEAIKLRYPAWDDGRSYFYQEDKILHIQDDETFGNALIELAREEEKQGPYAVWEIWNFS